MRFCAFLSATTDDKKLNSAFGSLHCLGVVGVAVAVTACGVGSRELIIQMITVCISVRVA